MKENKSGKIIKLLDQIYDMVLFVLILCCFCGSGTIIIITIIKGLYNLTNLLLAGLLILYAMILSGLFIYLKARGIKK